MLNNTFDKTIDILSGLVQKHVDINNKIKQSSLNQQNYQELNEKLDNLQKLIGFNSMKFYKCTSVTQAVDSSTTEIPSYMVAYTTEHELLGTYNYIGSNFVCVEDSTFNGAVWLREDGGKALIKADNGTIYAGDIFQVNKEASTFGGFMTHAMSTQNEAPVQGDMLSGINCFKLFNAMYMSNNVIITKADKFSYVITGDTSASSVNGTYNYIGQFYSVQMACYAHMWHQEGGNYYIVEDPLKYWPHGVFITDSVDGLDTGANKRVQTIGMPAVYYVNSSLYKAYETNSPVALVDSIQFTPTDSSRAAITCVKKAGDSAASTWAGYQMQQDAEGCWSFSQTITEQLEIKGFSPQVGIIYNSDTTIQISDYISKSQSDNSLPQLGPYGYRLKVTIGGSLDLQFIQDDLTKTGTQRTWTCVTSNYQQYVLYYNNDYGWRINEGNSILYGGFGSQEDPYPCTDDFDNAEITVIA